MAKIIKWFKWILKGRPKIKYKGFNCGFCGKWVNKEFEISEYQSGGEWWDTWGVCDECLEKLKKGQKE